MQRIIVSDESKGIEIAKKKIYEFVDQKTVLFLSGGKTPFNLYQKFASEKILKPGSVAMVDERYFTSEELRTNNEKLNSTNGKMIKNTGLLSYLESEKIPFYVILKNKPLEKTAKNYDRKVRKLLNQFQKNI